MFLQKLIGLFGVHWPNAQKTVTEVPWSLPRNCVKFWTRIRASKSDP
jgi:hypothetical protein